MYMLYRKTRSRSWKGVAVLGALPHFVRCVCQVPTPFQRSYATTYAHPAPYAVTSLSAFGGGVAGAKVCIPCRGRWCQRHQASVCGRWAVCVVICHFQTVGSASALSERTSRSEAVNLVSATHFHERERVWK